MTIHSIKNPGYQLDEAMLTMLDVCKRVSRIYVTSKLKPQTIETICQLQMANKIGEFKLVDSRAAKRAYSAYIHVHENVEQNDY